MPCLSELLSFARYRLKRYASPEWSVKACRPDEHLQRRLAGLHPPIFLCVVLGAITKISDCASFPEWSF